MHPLLRSAVILLCALPCSAQRLAVSIHEGGGPSTIVTACCGVAYAVPFSAAIAFPNGLASVSAVQFHLWTPVFGSHDLAIYDSDPATGLPRNALARGSFAVPANATGYWGTVLSTPADDTPGTASSSDSACSYHAPCASGVG